jgi:carboxymethylenebutenolidase
VVAFEATGLNADMRAQADRLAAAGYLTLVPDLFDGRPWVRCVRGAIQQLHAGSGPAFTMLDAAREWLTARDDCTGKTGVIGFCLGGGFALLCAASGDYTAAAVNYGEVPADAERVLAGTCPVVASYGARDMEIRAGHPRRLVSALTALNVPHDIKVYPGAGHSFMSGKPPALRPLMALLRLDFKPEATEDAWRRILTFFGQYLGSPPDAA